MPFNPFTQNVTLLDPSGTTPLPPIPIPIINTFNDETVSITLNYGTQLGASITTLLAILLLTSPVSKLARPSGILHILALLVSIVRMTLLAVYFLTPFSHFYEVWGQDYEKIPQWNFRLSVAGTVSTLVLLMVTEMALMYQAWTMVALLPGRAKHIILVASALIALVTIALRFAFTIIQSGDILDATSPSEYAWLVQGCAITNTLSICWFCAVFNIKLATHLITNRGVLPSRRAMSPMEVLVMANGILMIVPVVFSVLEWHHFINFESLSLTLTSVTVILPLGTLTAQRMAQPSQSTPCFSDFSSPSAANAYNERCRNASESGSHAPLKGGISAFSTTISNSSSPTRATQMSTLSPDEVVMLQQSTEKDVSF